LSLASAGFCVLIGIVLLSAFVVGVNAGLLLSALVVCLGLLIYLSLLATARGGASFPGP
jgi:hypothetical protein